MPDRILLGLGSLGVAGLVIVSAPVSFRIAATWTPELTVIVVCGLLAIVLVLGVVWAWAWRHREVAPADQVQAEALKLIRELLKRQKELPAPGQPALPARRVWKVPGFVDTTAQTLREE